MTAPPVIKAAMRDDESLLIKLLGAARGDTAADTLIKNGRIVNVFTGEICTANVAIHGTAIAGAGDFYTEGKNVIDAGGKYLLPGLIDAHIHIESSLLSPWEFARLVLKRGTTAVIADPHEIVNVLGARGVEYMISATDGLPLDFYFMAPSCVPATEMETAGAQFTQDDIARALRRENVLGLAEVMNFPGAVSGDESVLRKIRASAALKKLVDGHSPGLSGGALQAYLCAGPDTDHECVTADEAREKLRAGMKVMIREGTVEKNLSGLLPVVNEDNIHRLLFVSDDKSPAELLHGGHMDAILRKAVRMGLDPVRAVRMATLNPASFYGLGKRGAIAPGHIADIVIAGDLIDFRVDKVIKSGELVVDGGELAAPLPPHHDEAVTPGMNIKSISPDGFRIEDRGAKVRVIDIAPGQIITNQSAAAMPSKNGLLLADPRSDILKIAVVERHRGTGNVGLGWVRGLGLREGAIASSVAHDSHNVVVAGVDDQSMLAAVREIERMGGGLVAASGGSVRAVVPLPIAGLMSNEPAEAVVTRLENLLAEAAKMGSALENPYSALSFLALAVVPSLKITDKGLVDVDRMEFVSIYAA